jgi:3-dehydrosphinganine reductase
MVKEELIAQQPFIGKFALIPGGSKGMGKETAKLFIQLGGSVCIIARSMEALKETQDECNNLKTEASQFIEIISCDTTDMDKLKPLITDFIDKHGVPDYLMNFVGYAYVNYIEKLTLEDFKRNMDVNYYGQLVPTLIVLPYLLEAKKGYIVITSSGLGFVGIMGYATYVPTKFALVGLAEVLRNELLPYNIKVSVVYPADTDTPGFEEENKLKPPECAIISESVMTKIMTPEEFAEEFIEGILKGEFEILPGDMRKGIKEMRDDPDMVRGIMDSLYKRARRKTKRKI